MNILLINYEYPPLGGGAANATYHLAKELSIAHNVTVLTTSYSNLPRLEKKENLQVIRVAARRQSVHQSGIFEMLSFVISATWSLRSVVKTNNIQNAIIFFSFPCGPLGLMLKFLYNINYIISLRGGDVPGTERSLRIFHILLTPLRRLILKKALKVVANSEGLKDLSEKADPVHVEVISNGIDTQFFQPDNKRKDNRQFKFVFAGRFQSQKNVPQLVKLFALIKKSFHLHLVGDGPERSEVEALIIQHKLQKDITLHGWLDKKDLRTVLQESHCFINPSSYEGMPNVVLEAMACGLAVLASDVAGNDSVVKDRITGELFQYSDDLTNLLQPIEKLLQDHKLTKTYGKNGLIFCKKNFSWKKCTKDYNTMLLKADST